MFIKLRENKAFTLVEIMIVVAIIGLLVAIAIPNFVRARSTTRQNVCMNNMRVIGHAEEQYMMDSSTTTPVLVSALVTSGHLKSAPTCPSTALVGYTVVCTPDAGTVPCPATISHGTYYISTGGFTAPAA